MGDSLANEFVRPVQERERLVEIHNVDPVALGHDEALHFRVPATSLVAKVHPDSMSWRIVTTAMVFLPALLSRPPGTAVATQTAIWFVAVPVGTALSRPENRLGKPKDHGFDRCRRRQIRDVMSRDKLAHGEVYAIRHSTGSPAS